MISMLEQIEALNRCRPQQLTCAQVHTERRAHILVVLGTPRAVREVAKLLAITIAITQGYLEELADEGLITQVDGKWRRL